MRKKSKEMSFSEGQIFPILFPSFIKVDLIYIFTKFTRRGTEFQDKCHVHVPDSYNEELDDLTSISLLN